MYSTVAQITAHLFRKHFTSMHVTSCACILEIISMQAVTAIYLTVLASYSITVFGMCSCRQYNNYNCILTAIIIVMQNFTFIYRLTYKNAVSVQLYYYSYSMLYKLVTWQNCHCSTSINELHLHDNKLMVIVLKVHGMTMYGYKKCQRL